MPSHEHNIVVKSEFYILRPNKHRLSMSLLQMRVQLESDMLRMCFRRLHRCQRKLRSLLQVYIFCLLALTLIWSSVLKLQQSFLPSNSAPVVHSRPFSGNRISVGLPRFPPKPPACVFPHLNPFDPTLLKHIKHPRN